MSNKNGDTGVWSIRGNGEIVSEFGGYEFLGRCNITDMVLHWRELGFEYAIVSKDLFDKFVKDSLNMFVPPRLYLRRGKIEYEDFIIFQEKTQSTKSMSEYKENTVEWWLSQLKEPLGSKATKAFSEFHNSAVSESTASPSMALAISSFDWHKTEDLYNFWLGVKDFFLDYRKRDNSHGYIFGYDMAKKCAPDNWLKPKDGGEDKAIIDSPAPEVWGEKIPIGSFESFCKGMDVSSNPYQESVVQGMCERVPTSREIEPSDSYTITETVFSQDQINAMMNANPHMNFYDNDGNLLRKAIVDPAVVGYEEPKPIDTIEKKHEIRIQNLEARVKYLEDMVGSLSRSLDIITKRVFENG